MITDKKNNYLDLTFQAIADAHKLCFLFGEIYESLQIPEPPPCAANFRDMFFHYRKLYDSDFNEEYLAQYESSIEHCNRLFKDGIVKLTQVLVFASTKLMQTIPDEDTYMKLYDLNTDLKLIQFDLRAQALEIIRPLENEDAPHKILKRLCNFIDFTKQNDLFDDLLKFNSEYI